MQALFCIFFPVSAVQKLLKSVKIWQSCSQMYTATFYEPQQKRRFWFFQVRCAHKSGDVIKIITVACRIFSRLKWHKNYKNRLRLAKVIVKNKMSRFYGSLCIYATTLWRKLADHIDFNLIYYERLSADMCQVQWQPCLSSCPSPLFSQVSVQILESKSKFKPTETHRGAIH